MESGTNSLMIIRKKKWGSSSAWESKVKYAQCSEGRVKFVAAEPFGAHHDGQEPLAWCKVNI